MPALLILLKTDQSSNKRVKGIYVSGHRVFLPLLLLLLTTNHKRCKE